MRISIPVVVDVRLEQTADGWELLSTDIDLNEIAGEPLDETNQQPLHWTQEGLPVALAHTLLRQKLDQLPVPASEPKEVSLTDLFFLAKDALQNMKDTMAFAKSVHASQHHPLINQKRTPEVRLHDDRPIDVDPA